MNHNQSAHLKTLKAFTLSSKYEGQGYIIHVPTLGVWYDHDKVLSKVGGHYKNLPCWESYGYFKNGRNVPEDCQNLVHHSAVKL